MRTPTSLGLRVLIAGLFIGAWVLAGFALRLSADAYLLIGIPWTLLFQWGVHRQRLRNAWILPAHSIDSSKCVDPRYTWVWACMTLTVPVLTLCASADHVAGLSPRPDLAQWLWLTAALAGGLAATWTLSRQSRRAWRQSLPYTLMGIGCGLLVFTVAARPRNPMGLVLHANAQAARTFLSTAILYFDASFTLEEVVFRGVLAPYIMGSRSDAQGQYVSALASSMLWGVWHLPVAPFAGPAAAVPMLQIVLFHATFGVILVFAARSAGSLVPSAISHAVTDAYRNLIT